MYFHLSPLFKRHRFFFLFFFPCWQRLRDKRLNICQVMHSKQHWSSWMSIQLLWKAWGGIALLLAPRQCWPWKNIWLAVFTCCRILQLREAWDAFRALSAMQRKRVFVFDVSFSRVTPSAACCHRCGGTSSHSRRSSAARHIQWWGSIFNLVSPLSQLYVAPLTKSDKRPDSFSQIWVSFLATF